MRITVTDADSRTFHPGSPALAGAPFILHGKEAVTLEKYEKPTMEIVELTNDIIATSGEQELACSGMGSDRDIQC